MSMTSEAHTGRSQVAGPNNRTRSKRNKQTKHVQATDNLRLDEKCRSFIQGHCKFGELCKRSHGDPPGKVTTSPTVRMPTDVSQTQLPHHTSSTPATSSNVLEHPTTSSASTLSRPNARTTTAHTNPNPGTIPKKQTQKPCLSWAESGTCQFGSRCRDDHDVNVISRITLQRQENAVRIDRAGLARDATEPDVAQKVQKPQEEAAAADEAEAERARPARNQVKQQAELFEWDRARRASEVTEKAQHAQAGAAAEAEAVHARQAALQQAEAERVRARAHQAKQQAELLEWDRVRRAAALKALQAQEEVAAAEATDRARQEAVRQRARNARNARIEDARRAEDARSAREAAEVEVAQKVRQAQEEAAAADEAEAEGARRVALRQAEVDRVRAWAQQAKQQAELLEWDRVHRTAEVARKAQQ
ncbi:hypothetical protein FIBSPDRAFT_1055271, partial [Athelia psychrophila]